MSGSKEANNTKVLTVRLKREDFERLDERAKAEFRSLSHHVRFLIHQDLEGREKSWSQ